MNVERATDQPLGGNLSHTQDYTLTSLTFSSSQTTGCKVCSSPETGLPVTLPGRVTILTVCSLTHAVSELSLYSSWQRELIAAER